MSMDERKICGLILSALTALGALTVVTDVGDECTRCIEVLKGLYEKCREGG